MRIAVAAAACLLITPPAVAAQDPAALTPAVSHARSAAAVYERACATCHGPDGRGAPAASTTFSDPLPDFHVCGFATREPDADWLAVVHDGGPARAFGRMMPAFAGALSVDEMALALGHVRLFCKDTAWPRGELNLPRPLVTEKAFPEDEAVITTAVNAAGTGAVSNKLVYERRLGARSQFEAVVPFSFVDRGGDSGWSGGLGDLTLGMKHAFAHSVKRGSIVSGAAEISLPVGDDELGLSKGTAVFEPFVAFGQVLPREMFVQAQAGVELPFNRDLAAPESFWRLAGGFSVTEGRFGRTWSPMLELLAARELERGQPTLVDVVPQVQVTLSTRQHVMASLGVRVPVNRRDGRHPQVLFYVLWDWFDGPLGEGW
jgi:hypothetical protein